MKHEPISHSLTKLEWAKGLVRVNSSNISTPMAQKSTALLYPLLSTISGAMYSAAPHNYQKNNVEINVEHNTSHAILNTHPWNNNLTVLVFCPTVSRLAEPKSTIFRYPVPSTTRFSGLMLRYTMSWL